MRRGRIQKPDRQALQRPEVQSMPHVPFCDQRSVGHHIAVCQRLQVQPRDQHSGWATRKRFTALMPMNTNSATKKATGAMPHTASSGSLFISTWLKMSQPLGEGPGQGQVHCQSGTVSRL